MTPSPVVRRCRIAETRDWRPQCAADCGEQKAEQFQVPDKSAVKVVAGCSDECHSWTPGVRGLTENEWGKVEFLPQCLILFELSLHLIVLKSLKKRGFNQRFKASHQGLSLKSLVSVCL